MTSNRLVVEALSRLFQRVAVLETQNQQVDESLEEVDKQVKRLAKELYKSSLLQASNSHEDIQTLFQNLREDYEQQQQTAITQARFEMVQAFLPVLDAVESGWRSGISQVKRLRQTAPEAANILYSWLNGQRLLHERLLQLLEAEGIVPMQALGEPFDPYRHVAVKVQSVADKPANIVLKIERAGYVHGAEVLRFADVVVNKLD